MQCEVVPICENNFKKGLHTRDTTILPLPKFRKSPHSSTRATMVDSSTTTRLLTLLNVSATKSGKRKWDSEDTPRVEKLNKRKSVRLDTEETSDQTPVQDLISKDVPEENTTDDVEGAY